MTHTEKRRTLLVLLLSIAWFIGLIAVVILVAYVPGALNVVDDYRWGQRVARVVLAGLVPLMVASIQLARRKYVSAIVLAGIVVVALLSVDAYAITQALRHSGHTNK